ncbi:MAG: TetR/AcrR family transcriptional regulator [Rhodospirillaceae bacterium]|nr:TetR/AcrR family transcriptional regulator [Rhodospirillaceae bacterium]
MKKPRWQRRKEARPAEILTAALDVFAERGYAAAKLDDVAARAGVSKGTLYLYFDSKEELFRSVVRDLLVPNIAAAEQRVAEYRGPSAELLRGLIATLGRIVADSKLGAIPKLIIAEAANFPDLARFYHDEVISRGKRLIAGLIQRGIRAGEFRPVPIEEVLPMLVGPVMLLAVWQHSFGRAGVPPLPTEAVLARHADFLLRALAPEKPARKEAVHVHEG